MMPSFIQTSTIKAGETYFDAISAILDAHLNNVDLGVHRCDKLT